MLFHQRHWKQFNVELINAIFYKKKGQRSVKHIDGFLDQTKFAEVVGIKKTLFASLRERLPKEEVQQNEETQNAWNVYTCFCALTDRLYTIIPTYVKIYNDQLNFRQNLKK